MTAHDTEFRCKLCGRVFDIRSIAQTHVLHTHPPDGYEAVTASIEELD